MSKSPSVAKGFLFLTPVVMSCRCLAKRFDGDHISLLVMVFCSHIDNNYFSETFR